MARRVLTAAAAVARSQALDLNLIGTVGAALVGPRAELRRYTVAAERTAGSAYDPNASTLLAWPGLAAGEVVDLAYTRVYLEDALLKYFTKANGVNGTCQPSSTYPNRVRAANFVFKTGNGTARSAAFLDRDVRVGDTVDLSAVVSGSLVTHRSTVRDFVGETSAAVTGTAVAGAGNKSTQSATASVAQVDGTPANEVVAAVDGSGYDSLADGGVTRTYTVTVIQASTAGDATTARLKVVSSDGLDDQASVTPSAFGTATAVGTKGLEVTWSLDAGLASSLVPDDTDFLLGQQWTATVAQAFAAPTAAAGGTYTGPADDTYLVRVSRGGTLGDSPPPQITVTTATGGDRSGPTDLTGSGVAAAVGSYGVTLAVTGTTVRAGDTWSVPVTAAAAGAYRTLVLSDDVPAALRGVEVELDLYLGQSGVAVPATRTLPSAAANWSAAAAGVTVNAGLYLTDPTYTDGGAPVGLPLTEGTVFLHYRAWAPVPGANRVASVATPAAALAACGTSDPDNPLGWAATRALANTAGQLLTNPTASTAATTDPVTVVPVGDPTVLGNWTDAFAAVEDDPTVYHLVPLSTDPAVLAAAHAHVTAQSADAAGYQRRLLASGTVRESLPLVDATTTTDLAAATATVAAYPDLSPTVYTLVTLASGNAAFVTAGVRAGDTLRTNYGTDALGNVTYDAYAVEAVLSQTSLQLAAGPAAAVAVAQKIEIWRAPTRDELVTQLTAQAAAYADRRVSLVWPDAAAFGGAAVPGHTVAAALAGLYASVPTQQGLRGVGLAGVDAVPRSAGFFTAGQLARLAAGGVTVVTADADGNVFLLSDVTTSLASLADKDAMAVRNGDAVRFQVADDLLALTGAANMTSEVGRMATALVANREAKLKGLNTVVALGPPVQSLAVASIAGVAGAPDKLAVTLNVVGPTSVGALPLTINLSTGG